MAKHQSLRLCRASEEITYTRRWSASLPFGEWGFFLPLYTGAHSRPRIFMGTHSRPRIASRVATHNYGRPQLGVVVRIHTSVVHLSTSNVATWESGCPYFEVGFLVLLWVSTFGGWIALHKNGHPISAAFGYPHTWIGLPIWVDLDSRCG